MIDRKQFEYGGYHFMPERKFTKSDGDFYDISRKLRGNTEIGLCVADYVYECSFPYTYDGFYAASTDKKCDIFRCMENNKLYVPGENELFEYCR